MADVARVPAGPKIREWSRKHGFDDWMVARIVKLAGQSGLPSGSLPKLLDGLTRKAPQYVRANPLRCDRDEMTKRLEARGFRIRRCPLDNQMVEVLDAPISSGATQEHLLGMTTPQDLASSAAPLALDVQPGDVVADLAAAPGIKSLHVAGSLQGKGSLVCVEPDPDRMRGLRFNLERCGVANAITREEAAQDIPGEAWADKVLLDAPCTGEGTLPKDRSRRRGDPAEIGQLADLQAELLDAADRILKPGGVLAYATCTFAPEENEAQVQRMIERGYTVEPLPFDKCIAPLGRGVTEWPGLELDASLSKTARFFPGIHPTLGFYVARLRKGGA